MSTSNTTSPIQNSSETISPTPAAAALASTASTTASAAAGGGRRNVMGQVAYAGMQPNLLLRPKNMQELKAIHSEGQATAVFYVATILCMYFLGLLVIFVHYMNSSYGKWTWTCSDVWDELRPNRATSQDQNNSNASEHHHQFMTTSFVANIQVPNRPVPGKPVNLTSSVQDYNDGRKGITVEINAPCPPTMSASSSSSSSQRSDSNLKSCDIHATSHHKVTKRISQATEDADVIRTLNSSLSSSNLWSQGFGRFRLKRNAKKLVKKSNSASDEDVEAEINISPPADEDQGLGSPTCSAKSKSRSKKERLKEQEVENSQMKDAENIELYRQM